MILNWRYWNGGWLHARPTTNRGNSRNYLNGRYNRFQTVPRHRIRFVSDLDNKKFLRGSETTINYKVLCREETGEV